MERKSLERKGKLVMRGVEFARLFEDALSQFGVATNDSSNVVDAGVGEQ